MIGTNQATTFATYHIIEDPFRGIGIDRDRGEGLNELLLDCKHRIKKAWLLTDLRISIEHQVIPRLLIESHFPNLGHQELSP